MILKQNKLINAKIIKDKFYEKLFEENILIYKKGKI